MRYPTIFGFCLCFSLVSSLSGGALSGQVVEVNTDERVALVKIQSSNDAALAKDSVTRFRIGVGDLEIGYIGRKIKAVAANYAGEWHLETIFPVDGLGSKAVGDVNKQLRDATASLSRREFVREGDYIPNFGMIDQNGRFTQIKELQGSPFVLNFIFTRCAVARMCPASSSRMSQLQDLARENGPKDLQFVTISFDPEFDSPGILRQYADGFGIEADNFRLLTGKSQVVKDLLRQFGILTMDEEGTINHTMATLLIDKNGRVAFRKEGSSWEVAEFLEEARKL